MTRLFATVVAALLMMTAVPSTAFADTAHNANVATAHALAECFKNWLAFDLSASPSFAAPEHAVEDSDRLLGECKSEANAYLNTCIAIPGRDKVDCNSEISLSVLMALGTAHNIRENRK